MSSPSHIVQGHFTVSQNGGGLRRCSQQLWDFSLLKQQHLSRQQNTPSLGIVSWSPYISQPRSPAVRLHVAISKNKTSLFWVSPSLRFGFARLHMCSLLLILSQLSYCFWETSLCVERLASESFLLTFNMGGYQTVLVSLGGCNRLPMTERSKPQKFISQLWRLGSPRSRCQQGRFHSEVPSLAL